ncbi:MAG: AraC family transcriptional regulator [Puniceicoccaceae bacterium]
MSQAIKPLDPSPWDIPNPRNYFHGLQLSNLTLADNILLFHRRSREFLNVRNFESRPHHRFVLIFNCGTPGSINVDGDTFHFQPGQAFLIAPLQFHFYLDIPDERISWLYMTFLSDQPDLLIPLRNAPVWLHREDWRILDTIGTQYRSLIDPILTDHHVTVDTNIWILQCNRLIQRLLNSATSAGKLPEIAKRSKSHQDEFLLSRVNEFLEKDTFQQANLPELAKKLHISPSHLRRRFKAITGLSLGTYHLNYRMNRAIKYLLNTDTSLTEIAELCGYDSISAFSRSFKLRFGVSPSQYRKQYTT